MCNPGAIWTHDPLAISQKLILHEHPLISIRVRVPLCAKLLLYVQNATFMDLTCLKAEALDFLLHVQLGFWLEQFPFLSVSICSQCTDAFLRSSYMGMPWLESCKENVTHIGKRSQVLSCIGSP